MYAELPKFLTEPNPDIYLSDNYLVLDKETTNVEYGHARNPHNRHLLSCWRDSRGIHHKFSSEYGLEELHRAIANADFIVAHNAKFELQWLKREGVDISKILVYDTLLGEYVLAGNRSWDLDLDSVSRRYGVGTKSSYISCAIKGGVCPSELPTSLLLAYCHNDVDVTREIFLQQRKILKASNLLPVLYTRCIFTPVLADIEYLGMHLDKDRVVNEYTETAKRRAELEAKLIEVAGGINLNSPKQIGTYLYKTLGFAELRDYKGNILKTPTGNALTDSATILALKVTTKEQQQFSDLYLEFNKVDSALSKNLEYFYGVVTEGDGVFFANFNQAVTKTHRLSSSGKSTEFKQFVHKKTGKPKAKSVQFQNFPRVYKKLFSARNPEDVMGERDAAQLEFRVAAFLGQDETALADILNGADVHSFTASVLTEAGQATDRQGAKAHTFKPLYGGSSGTEAEKTYYAAFKEKYFQIAATQQGWAESVLNNKQLVVSTGLVFYWPDTTMSRSGYISNTASIYNYPVQNLATAEIIPIEVTYLWHYMKALKLRSFITNTIHDSIITEEKKDETKLIDELSNYVITVDVIKYLKIVYNIDFDIPLKMDCKAGPFWGEKS